MNEFYKTLLNPKGKFGIWGIVILVLAGIALMIVPGVFLNKNDAAQKSGEPINPIKIADSSSTSSPVLALEKSLSQQISNILSQVEGAGNVSVSVSLEAGPETDFAENVTSDTSTIEEKDTSGGTRTTSTMNNKTEVVFAQNQNNPLIIKEKGAQIRGVLVVAEGARDSEIKIKLNHAVQAMLNLPAHRIMVLTKESR